MKTAAIIADTFRECLGKKILLAFFLASTFTLIAAMVLFDIDIIGNEVALSALFSDHQELLGIKEFGVGVVKIQAVFALMLFSIGLLMSIFATADIIPSLMMKGRLDLYLARPVSRAQLLIGKYIGAVSIVSLNILYAIGGLWLILGVKTGIWNVNFLFSALTIVFMFAVMYTVIMFIGLFVGSTAVMLIAAMFMMSFSSILAQREEIFMITEPGFWKTALETSSDILYWILPKYYEVSLITKDLVEGLPMPSWTPVISSTIVAIVVMNLGIVLFNRKNC